MRNNETLSKTERAHQWIKHNIHNHVYPAGHRLVLSTIAAELDVSVVPVREAIRQLEAEGLVTFERNVGARVAIIEKQDYFETMEVVAVLEAAATAASVPYLSPADLAKARELNEKMEATLADFDPKDFTELNRKFHKTLFGKCPNKRLVELVYEEWRQLDYLRESTFGFIPNRAADSVEEHHRLISLIQAQAEPRYIEQIARDHRLNTLTSYKSSLVEEADRRSFLSPDTDR